MKLVTRVLISLLFVLCSSISGYTEDASSAMKRIGAEVADLSLGFKNYMLGQHLTEEQIAFAKDNSIKKSLKGTYKFLDEDVYVVAKADDHMIIGIYKQFDSASREVVKQVVGDMMMRFNEPTTMAHDQLIYWAYDKNGKVSQDMYDSLKQEGESTIIATVKLQSSISIFPDPDPQEEDAEKVKEKFEKEQADLYVMITSNPLSKIFLAQKQ